MLTNEFTDLLSRLDGVNGGADAFVESPDVLAYGPAANRVARLRLAEPMLADRLLRLDRASWHCHVAMILATQQDDAQIVASRLLHTSDPATLLAQAVGMRAVPSACLRLLKNAPHQALPLDCYRLLARGTEDYLMAQAYRNALASKSERLSVRGFVKVLQDTTVACAEDPLAAELGSIQAEYRTGLARVIRTLRHLGLLGPEDQERRCLRRLRHLEDFTSWATRRLKKAVAPAAFSWLKVPMPGFHPIESASCLSEKARLLRNCAGQMRYLLDLATGLASFATLRSPGYKSQHEEHLVQFHVCGRYVRVLEMKRADNEEALLSARLQLERVFRANEVEWVGGPVDLDFEWMVNGL